MTPTIERNVTQTLSQYREFSGTLADTREFRPIIQEQRHDAGAKTKTAEAAIVAECEAQPLRPQRPKRDTDSIIENVATLTTIWRTARGSTGAGEDQRLVARSMRSPAAETLGIIRLLRTFAENGQSRPDRCKETPV